MPSLTLVPTPGPYAIGDTIFVNLITSADFPEFLGFQSQLTYNANALTFVGATINDVFDLPAPVPTEPSDASGSTTLSPLSAGAFTDTPSGQLTLATLEFEVKSTDASVDIILEPLGGILISDLAGINIPLDNPLPVSTTLAFETNSDPDVSDGVVTTPEDTAVEIDVLADATDPDVTDTLSIDSFSQGSNGTVTQTSGGLTYAPNANFNGSDSFTYVIADGNGGSDTATVNVTVDPVNDLPTGGVAIAGTAEEGQTLTASNTLADADGLGPISYQWKADGANIPGATGETLVLGQAQVGDQITVEASYTDGDGTAESVSSAPTAAVADVVTPPATGSVTLVPSPGPYAVGDTIQIQIVTSPGFPAILGFQANLAYDADVLSLISVDYLEDFDVQSPVSEPTDASGPIVVGPVSGGEFDSPSEISGQFVAATLSFEVKSTGAVTVDLLPFGGRLFIDDNNVDIDLVAPVSIDLVLNSDPEAVDDGATVAEDGSIEVNVLANDSDADTGDVPAIDSFGQGSNGTVTLTAGGLTYTPDANFNGDDSFTYTITDGNGGFDTATVNITVDAVNDAPTGGVTIDGLAQQGETLTASNTLADADGLGAISFQWQADGVDIAGATGDTLVLGQDQVGAAISVVASYTDGQNTDESVSSGQTAAVANVNDDPLGEVLIIGTAEEGQTLTADASGLSDLDGLGAFSFQWQADGVDIAGATAETLALGADLIGAEITVVASYLDGFGTPESVTSAASDPVANVNDAPEGDVTITGTAQQGETLTATNDLTDADGLGTISYQWQADGADIAGATGDTLVLGQDQVGAAITVVASYTDDQGTAESVASAATAAVANVNDDPLGDVLILGTAEEGATLTADVSGVTDLDGLGAFSFQWQSNGVNIPGASANTLLLGQQLVGSTITVVASYVDQFGTPESVTSAASDPVANVNDAPEGDVTITGTAQQGETLTATNDLTDADGLGTISYQWQADGVDIAGATGDTLVLGQDQVGAAISVVASYTDGQNTDESVSSGPTAAVANVNDDPVGEVLIIGSASEGETLTADASGLSDLDGLGLIMFQWQADGVDIPGAMGSTLDLGPDLVGAVVTVVASYVDGFNTAESIQSAPTVPVSLANEVPIAEDDTAIVDEDEAATINVLNNDIDPDGGNPPGTDPEVDIPSNENLTVAIFSGPANGTAEVNPDGSITYTPFDDFNGPDSFVYQVTDPEGASDTATVDISVNPVNDAPVLDLPGTVDYLDSATGTVFTAAATDVDAGDMLTFSLSGADAAFFDIDPTTGEVTLSATTPPAFTIADGDIASAADVTQTFDLLVGVTDGEAPVEQTVTVSFLKDTDEDGIADISDNAIFAKNTNQRDTDGDGYGNIIDADLNNDGSVLIDDLFIFRAAFGTSGLVDGVDAAADADFTGDGAVNISDLAIFRNLFGSNIEDQSLVGTDFQEILML